jgi:hypothetical protein
MYTVPLALRSFIDATTGTTWGPMFAMSVVSLLPVFLAFLIGQRFLVGGINGNEPGEGPVSLRWVLTHMLEEYARHNGHADLLREQIDGTVGL